MGRTAVSTQLGFMATIACADIRADLPKIACPTLVITTEESGLGTVDETRAWQQQIPDSELVVLPGNSYHVAATHADRAAEATLDFIGRRGGSKEESAAMVEIRRVGPQIGVEVTGVDVKTLDDAGFAPIYQAWLDHNVMVVRDQELTLEEFLHYSRRFGLVVPHPSKSTRHPEVPEITLLGVNKFDADGKLNEAIYRRGAEGWHTDGAYDAEPFKATQLYALAIPSTGGDTLFANGYAAYDAMPERLKQRLEGRDGRVHLWRAQEEA